MIHVHEMDAVEQRVLGPDYGGGITSDLWGSKYLVSNMCVRVCVCVCGGKDTFIYIYIYYFLLFRLLCSLYSGGVLFSHLSYINSYMSKKVDFNVIMLNFVYPLINSYISVSK